MSDAEEKLYTKGEVSEIVKARLRSVRPDPHGLALVVSALADRVQRLEEHAAKLEAKLSVLADIG